MHDDMGDVVVLLPGFGGSVLERDGRVLWGGDGHASAATLLALGADAVELLRVDRDDPSRPELPDGVRATGVVHGAHMLPGVWKIDGYAKIPRLLGRLFDVEPGRNYHEFAYDWRRDVRAAAKALDRVAGKWLEDWREQSGREDARLVLIGHSMGAMVARYYLEVLDGWKNARALVTFGAPFRGTPAVLRALTGPAPSLELGGGDLRTLARSFTSLYQMLPVYPAYHEGAGDGEGEGDGEELVVASEVEIPGLDPEKVALAAGLRAEIDEALRRHDGNPAYREGSYRLLPVVGTAQTTPQSARLADGEVEVLNTYQNRDLSGDGLVPRLGAQPNAAGDPPATLITAARHSELASDDRALSYVLGLFTSLYMGAAQVAPPVRNRAGLDVVVEDATMAGSPISVSVFPESREVGPLTATIEKVAGGEVLESIELGSPDPSSDDGRWRRGEFAPREPGVYRVRVAGDDTVQPVSDVLEVLPAAATG